MPGASGASRCSRASTWSPRRSASASAARASPSPPMSSSSPTCSTPMATSRFLLVTADLGEVGFGVQLQDRYLAGTLGAGRKHFDQAPTATSHFGILVTPLVGPGQQNSRSYTSTIQRTQFQSKFIQGYFWIQLIPKLNSASYICETLGCVAGWFKYCR